MNNILVIQTAFIGDAILATGILEKLHQHYPTAKIDYLVRKGNESLFTNHPFINKVLVWNKQEQKFKNLLNILKQVRKHKYDLTINLQRFASSGFITVCSGSKQTRGFKKNPLSFMFTKSFPHHIGDGTHEIARNHQLIQDLTDKKPCKPKLYPTENNYFTIEQYIKEPYICIAPTSVWFTKQLPASKWITLINKQTKTLNIYLLGAPSDFNACENIKEKAKHSNCVNLAGKLSLLQSTALMEKAIMNYVNDSAPLHLASSVNAPVSAFFCSTIPNFGFGPLSDNATIFETTIDLKCRPCGLHGFKQCPKGHFNCAHSIEI